MRGGWGRATARDAVMRAKPPRTPWQGRGGAPPARPCRRTASQSPPHLKPPAGRRDAGAHAPRAPPHGAHGCRRRGSWWWARRARRPLPAAGPVARRGDAPDGLRRADAHEARRSSPTSRSRRASAAPPRATRRPRPRYARAHGAGWREGGQSGGGWVRARGAQRLHSWRVGRRGAVWRCSHAADGTRVQCVGARVCSADAWRLSAGARLLTGPVLRRATTGCAAPARQWATRTSGKRRPSCADCAPRAPRPAPRAPRCGGGRALWRSGARVRG